MATDVVTSAISMKVSLREVGAIALSRVFVCQTTPTISESQTIEYKQFNPIHAPGSISTYVNTPSRTFTLGEVKLISRTEQEALKSLQQLRLLRSWSKPVFGEGAQAALFQESDVLGSPPRVLYLSAYTNTQINQEDKLRGLLKNIPVVMTSLTITFPNDVDYIILSKENGGAAVPIMMTVDIGLTETHSPIEYTKFNIAKYRAGEMVNF